MWKKVVTAGHNWCPGLPPALWLLTYQWPPSSQDLILEHCGERQSITLSLIRAESEALEREVSGALEREAELAEKLKQEEANAGAALGRIKAAGVLAALAGITAAGAYVFQVSNIGDVYAQEALTVKLRDDITMLYSGKRVKGKGAKK